MTKSEKSVIENTPEDGQEPEVISPTQPGTIAMRVTLSEDANDYLSDLVRLSRQDKGVIVESFIEAFRSLSKEEQKALIGKVVSNRLNNL